MQCNADQFFSLLKNTAMPELKIPSDSLSTLDKMIETRTVKKKDSLCSQLACQVMILCPNSSQKTQSFQIRIHVLAETSSFSNGSCKRINKVCQAWAKRRTFHETNQTLIWVDLN